MLPLDRFTPAASVTSRLVVAAAIWTLVGAALLAAGLNWLSAAEPLWAVAGLAVALALGAAKGIWLLAPRARHNALRIEAAGERRCVGGVFSWSAWSFVAAMMALGAGLRYAGLPRPWLGVLYCAVGVALVAGSASVWRRVRARGRGRPLP